jgi:hypothetical protein
LKHTQAPKWQQLPLDQINTTRERLRELALSRS